MDLKAHLIENHSDNIVGQKAKREAKRIDVQFGSTSRQQQQQQQRRREKEPEVKPRPSNSSEIFLTPFLHIYIYIWFIMLDYTKYCQAQYLESIWGPEQQIQARY